jgi:hypothetical protein
LRVGYTILANHSRRGSTVRMPDFGFISLKRW